MTKNYINVSVSTSKPTRVNVSAPANQQNIDVTRDTSAYNAELSKLWAVSESLVLSEDYSSKYYANVSKNHAENAKNYLDTTIENYNNFIDQSSDALGQITDLKDVAKEEINSTKTSVIGDIEFVADGEKQEIEELIDSGKDEIQDLADIIKENAQDIANRTSFAMFDTILKDHILTYEETKGLALQGTWVYKEAIAGSRYGYPDFYNKVVEEYNEASSLGVQTITIGGKSINMFVHPNGHMYYKASDAYVTSVNNFFDAVGVAWFYGLDTTNKRVLLPKKDLLKFSNTRTFNVSVFGTGQSLGLTTNGTNSYRLKQTSTAEEPLQAISGGLATLPATSDAVAGTGTNNAIFGINTSASKSGIKGSVDLTSLVTEETNSYLYICVGNTTNYEGMTEVVNQGMEILEQVNQGMSTRADGQWVNKYLQASTAVAVGTYTIDLSSYLPNDGYMYEVLCQLNLNQSDSGTNTYSQLKSDVITGNYLGIGSDSNLGGVNMAQSGAIPVYKTLTNAITGADGTSGSVRLYGYRRLGTNP